MSSLTWEDRAPFLDTQGRRRVEERYFACGDAIEKAFRLKSGSIRRSKKLGCGYYGCAYVLPMQPEDRAVMKVTSDPLEANAVAHLLHLKKKGRLPKGLLDVHGVRQLGKCSLKGRRDARMLWAIWREELDDSVPEVRSLGHTRKAYEEVLDELVDYLEDKKNSAAFRTTRSEMRKRLLPYRGEALLDACEWLLRHGMFALDVVKPDNIGWRKNTGLVIRDIGATEADRDIRKNIQKAGGVSGMAWLLLLPP